MKTHLLLGLAIIFAAGQLSVRGEDNPAQAAARAALVKFLMESNPSQTNSPTQANPPALVTPPSPVAPVAKPVPPAPVVLTAPASPPVSDNPPASNGAKGRSKSTWDVATQPADTTAPESKPTPLAFSVPPPASVRAATVPVPVAAAPVAMTAPAPVAPVKAQRPPPPRTAPVITGTDIVTIYGTVYKNAVVEKVDSEGLIISYSTPGGGLGMTKVYFKELPAIDRELYHR